MGNAMTGKRLLNLEEAAKYMGLAPQTVRNRIFERTFPVGFCRLGRKIVFDVRDIDAWIDSLKRFGGKS